VLTEATHKVTNPADTKISQVGRWSWNKRYGILVHIVSGKTIQDAKIIEFSRDDKVAVVPQSAIDKDTEISIVFDEYTDAMIGLANYKINKSVIVRDGKVFALVSGREVEIHEMPNKPDAGDGK